MHAFDVLGDPVRRRLLELLADGDRSAGDLTEAVVREFGITQSAVSQHLRVLRENGFAASRADGPRRVYSFEPEGMRQVDEWVTPFRRFWMPRLAALETEIARGKRERRTTKNQGERE
ncbi:MAG TPA: metalloregulator ArsR/SmtB family transcription factor [Microbacterium sp.]|uniref:ArsR/SmtB family transcription factor n=1 Tax=Microbacterium sp. TaxID=51671 RepID=UPI002BEEED67|nr:metalloregulator ArsR/SmtB family transcription factor [Microbacterium sp.]HWI31046.1 metalloregulator ArsR/SmtB family transcription factor [Microbacterium sp.]